MTKLPTIQHLTFDPHHRVQRVVLVGVGGTGAAWARSLCRILYDLTQRGQQAPSLTLIDPDGVEPHNVGRQLFTPADVGSHKAEVIAKRFSYALGLPVSWLAAPFDPAQHVGYGTLLCGAIDTHLARRQLCAACEQHGVVYIDAGNAYHTGQVVVGNTGDAERVRRGLAHPERHLTWLPHVGVVFPSILEPEPPPETPAPSPTASCAEQVERGEQHLLINDAVATVAAHYCYRLLHYQPLTSHVTYLDMDGLNVRSHPLTAEALAQYIPADAKGDDDDD